MVEPEEKARKKIDEMLKETGWIIQDYKELNLGAGFGIAVREFPLGKDSADYAIFIDRNPVGVIEAKKVGHTLSGVTEQSEGYLKLLAQKFPNAPRAPPFSYETTGIETLFADRRDPDYRSRHVLTFHTPETLADWLRDEKPLRARLKEIPKLDYQNLRVCQIQAIKNLEDSFTENKPRALIQMASGSGKTFTAITSCYRLIKYAKAKRILFLVDRNNLGLQTLGEFNKYKVPETGRDLKDLYNVQHLQSQTIDPVSKVVISTIQRVYSILSGQKELDPENEEISEFELSTDQPPVEVQYNQNMPIGQFDFIIIDECHRSIYNKWRQVLDYFDSFLIGLTATPSLNTISFFNDNQVMTYPHERAVEDKVNVGYHIFRIKTQKTEHGDTLVADQIIEKRDRLTRVKQASILDEEFEYSASDLDRSVVAREQIRKVIETFRDNLPIIFPDRKVVPKTLVFAKDDSHAEDITEIIREVFGKGNEFCKKITYKTTGDKPEELIKRFTNSTMPRIAVSVDMIATGTDIRPLECLLFMRDVRSRIYFDQMKGRGTRTIDPNDLIAVTPDAKLKDHFVIVDAVGVTEHAMTDIHSMERNPGESLKNLLEKAALGIADEDDLESLAYRLGRIDDKIDSSAKEEIKKESGGLTLNDIIHKLLNGIDADLHEASAKKKFGVGEPTEEQIAEVRKESVKEACKVLDAARLRSTILEVKSRSEQIIDLTPDILIFAGFGEKAMDASRDAIERFKKFLEERKDDMVALQIIYSKPQRLKEITYNDIKELAEKIKMPPVNLTPDNLWQAYKNLERDKVKDNPQKILTDLISIIRYTLHQEDMLVPFGQKVDKKFEKWLVDQESKGRKFNQEQKDWLLMIKDQIATSISATLEDMDDIPFSEKGGRIKLYKLFGEDYQKILEELHEVLISA